MNQLIQRGIFLPDLDTRAQMPYTTCISLTTA